MGKGKKETVYSFVLSILSKVLAYLLILVFANYYTQADFGRASFVVSALNLTLLFSLVGVSTIFITWYVKKKDYFSIFYFMAAITAATMLAWLAIGITHPWILPFILVLPFLFFYNVSGAILRSEHRYHLAQFGNVLFMLLTVLGALLLHNLGKEGIIWAYSLGYIVSSLWLMVCTRKNIYDIFKNFRFKFSSIKEYFFSGVVTTLIILSFSFLGWLDSTILGWLSTYENVAVYNIVGSVSNILTLIPISVGMFLLTRTAEIKNKMASKSVFERVLRVSYSSSLILAIVLVSLLPLLFRLFFQTYIGSEIYVMILSIGIMLYGIYFLAYMHVMGELKPEKALIPIGSAAILNIILDLLLIPMFGLYGITFATTMAHLTAFILLTNRLEIKSEARKMLIPIIFIPIAFFIGYYGLLLIPFALFFVAKLGLVQRGDIDSVTHTVMSIINRN